MGSCDTGNSGKLLSNRPGRDAPGWLEGSWFGPGRIRTYDQGIHLAPTFPPGVDYLFTRAQSLCVWVRDAPSLLSRALAALR